VGVLQTVKLAVLCSIGWRPFVPRAVLLVGVLQAGAVAARCCKYCYVYVPRAPVLVSVFQTFEVPPLCEPARYCPAPRTGLADAAIVHTLEAGQMTLLCSNLYALQTAAGSDIFHDGTREGTLQFVERVAAKGDVQSKGLQRHLCWKEICIQINCNAPRPSARLVLQKRPMGVQTKKAQVIVNNAS